MKGPSTFVPAPEAYILAAVLYLMSALATLALLRDRRFSRPAIVGAVLAYPAAAAARVALLPRS